MWNNIGNLSWGACIHTTVDRVCDPQGQFNREGGEFEAVTYADLVELEATRAREQATVPLAGGNRLLLAQAIRRGGRNHN